MTGSQGVSAVYRKWINIYFFKRLFLWKYSKCAMCDYSDIPIAYVLREGVVVILWWALAKAHTHTKNILECWAHRQPENAWHHQLNSLPNMAALGKVSRSKQTPAVVEEQSPEQKAPGQALLRPYTVPTRVTQTQFVWGSATYQNPAFWWTIELSEPIFFPET